MNKKNRCKKLTEKLKNFKFTELLNPSEISGGKYDSDHVDAWARWMENLDADIMLVGKDFFLQTQQN